MMEKKLWDILRTLWWKSALMINAFSCVLWKRLQMLCITLIGTTMTRSMKLSFKDLMSRKYCSESALRNSACSAISKATLIQDSLCNGHLHLDWDLDKVRQSRLHHKQPLNGFIHQHHGSPINKLGEHRNCLSPGDKIYNKLKNAKSEYMNRNFIMNNEVFSLVLRAQLACVDT